MKRLNSMAKFKVGDKVVYNAGFTPIWEGHKAVVVEAASSGWISVAWLTVPKTAHFVDLYVGAVSYLADKKFSLIEPPKEGEYVVISRPKSSPGEFVASCHPYVHPSLKAAETEAKRLAGLNRNAEFYVFKAVSKAVPPVVPAATIVTL
jgi:hypothetical protein